MTDPHTSSFPTHADRHLRMVREPMFSGLDLVAFLLALVMVCMPLALGAMGL